MGGLLPVSAAERRWIEAQIQPADCQPVSVSAGLHLLRVHGADGRFLRGEPASAAKLLELLTDDRQGRAFFKAPVLLRTRDGVRYALPPDRLELRNRGQEAHPDQCLGLLAELGVPLSQPLHLGGDPATLRG